jgi:hypothetical protein
MSHKSSRACRCACGIPAVEAAFLAEHGVFQRLNPNAESLPPPPSQKQREARRSYLARFPEKTEMILLTDRPPQLGTPIRLQEEISAAAPLAPTSCKNPRRFAKPHRHDIRQFLYPSWIRQISFAKACLAESSSTMEHRLRSCTRAKSRLWQFNVLEISGFRMRK